MTELLWFLTDTPWEEMLEWVSIAWSFAIPARAQQ